MKENSLNDLEMNVMRRIFVETKDKKEEIHINHQDRNYLRIVANNFRV